MGKEHNTFEMDIALQYEAAEVVELEDLSLALVGGGEAVVAV